MAQYPSSNPTLAYLLEAINSAGTVLTAGIDDSVTTLPVANTAVFPSEGVVTIGTEIIHYTSKDASNFLGCTRAYDGSSAAAHLLNDPVLRNVIAADHNRSREEINAMAVDLRNTFKADLDDSVPAASVAATLKVRFDHLVTQLKNLINGTDWKSVPTSNVNALKTQQDINTPAISDNAADISDNAAAIANNRLNLPNILSNGGLEVWQRGTSFLNPTSGDYTADRWQYLSDGTATLTIERSTVEMNGLYALGYTIAGVGTSTYINIRQNVEVPYKYRSKNVSLSMSVYASVANACRISITDDVGTSFSSYHSGGSSYETLTATLAVNASATALRITMHFDNNLTTTSVLMDSAMLVVGNEAVAFVPERPEQELARCQRYYQRVGGNVAVEQLVTHQATTTTGTEGGIRLPVTMSGTPTVTIVNANNFRLANAGGSALTTTGGSSGSPHPLGSYIAFAVAAGLVAGNAVIVATNAITSYIEYEV